MMKFISRAISALLAAALFFSLAACASSAALSDWKDGEEEVAFGSDYRLMTTVSDEDGNTYDVSAEVSVNDTPVTVTGNSFTVSEKGSYRVVYTAEGHENTMTVILKVVDRTAPVITIGERVTFVAAGEKYYLPEVSVHEEFDETAPECTVTVIAEDGTALKKEKDDIGEYVVPENDGTYTYNASAQDIAGNKRDESFTFEAVSVQEGEWNLLSSESVSLATRTYSEAYAQNYQWYESVLGEEGVISYDLVGGVDAEFPLDYFGVMPIVKDVARYKDAGWLVMRMYFDGDDGSVKNLWYGHSNIGRLSFPEIVYNEWNDYYLRITDEFVGSFKDFADGTNFSRIHGELEKNVKVYLDGIYVTSEGPQDATPIQESEVVFINNDLSGNHIYNLNSAIQSEFVSSEDMTPLGFDGEYDGNAIKFVASDYAHINAEYMIDPRIDATAYDAAVTAGYTHMYIWVCISADDGSNLLGGLFRPGTESWGIPTANTWIKVSVALTDDLKEKLFTEGGTQLFSTWADNQTGKQEIYVGNIGFEKQVSLADEGYVVRIDGAETLANIFNASADIQSEFVSSEDMAALGFAGEYDGNAIKFTATGAGYNNYGYTLVPAITAEEYDAAIEKNGYTHLYIWICLSADNGSSVWDGLFVPQGGMWAIPTYDLWTKLTIELTPELKEKLFENGGAPLLRIYTDDQSGRQELYVGNIGFEKQVSLADEGYVVRIDGAETLANISNTDGIPSEFVAATDMVELNFTGDYSGNAIKFTAGDGAHMNGGYKFVPAVTQAEYENAIVKNGYTHLYIWVCASADDGVALFDGLLGTGNNWGIPKADTWIKVSVPLSDDLKTRLFADGGTQLLRTWTDNVQAGKQEIYVGNIGFEKQAA